MNSNEFPRVIVADVPWRFDDALPGLKRGAASHYATLSFEEALSFPIPEVNANSFLFFWRVSSMVEEAYAVVRAWGFEPVSEIVWRKISAGGKRHFGMGRTVRMEHECCVVARRGRPVVRSHSVRSVFDAPVGVHSAKPDAFYSLVEELAYGPYHECFARRRRPGWTQEGLELDVFGGKGENR